MSSASMLAIEAAASRGSRLSQVRLARLFVEHHPLIWRTLRRLGLSPALAAQVTEQVCSAAAKELGGASRGAPPEDERVAVLRHMLRQMPRAQLLAASAPAAPAIQAAEESAAFMDRVLREMSRPAVVVFILFELEGLPLNAVGRVVDMDEQAALSALMRAREEFTALVAELREASR
jgi:DNA-directed RNA polymerase specialized sigma24 family protein